MLALVFFLAASVAVDLFTPSSAVSVTTLTGGSCNYDPVKHLSSIAAPAQLRIAWSLLAPDAALYDTKLYKNGALLAILANTVQSYDETLSGVEDTATAVPVNWGYRVDVVRKSDGVVISTKSSAAWAHSYGDCAGFFP